MRLCIANKRIVRTVYLWFSTSVNGLPENFHAWLCVSLRRGNSKPDFKICLTLCREPRDLAYSLAHTQKSALEVQLEGKGKGLKNTATS